MSPTDSTRRGGSAALLLFCCLFSAQAAFLTLSPILPELARDLHVTVSAAGQLQTLAGLCGGAAALGVAFARRTVDAHGLLARGLAAIAAGSALSAIAPSFWTLFGAEALLGAGAATVAAGGVAAVPAWTTPEERPRVLAWALLGQPGAWVIGMPVIGAVARVDWRLAWVAVPLAASLVASVAVAAHARRGDAGARPVVAESGRRAWRRPTVRAWAIGELLAQAAWSGVLVYAGALLTDRYGVGLGSVGVLLGLVAIAYFPAALYARRHVAAHARALTVGLALAAAVATAVLGLARPGAGASAGLLALLMAIVGARGLAGSALGLQTAPERPVEISGVRSATQQFGGLLGAALGGVTLNTGDWPAWGAVLAALFALATAPYAALGLAGIRRGAPRGPAPAMA